MTGVHGQTPTYAVNICARVSAVRRFGRYALVDLLAPAIAGRAKPGQFVMVAVPGEGFHLRRPLSVHSLADDAVRLLIEPRGAGSRALAGVAVGDTLGVAGPLGSGFPTAGVSRGLLVGGGIGVAPLQLVADVLVARGAGVAAACGFRDAGQARLASALDIAELSVATEDGSVGRRGTAVELVTTLDVAAQTTVYACGPQPMLEALGRWATERRLDAYGSLEAHMACGSGSCHGCVVATAQGLRRVCVDGPVFALTSLLEAS